MHHSRRAFLAFLGAGSLAALAFPQAPEEKPLPPKMPPERLDGPPIVSAKAWAILEGRTGRLLWGDHAAEALPMASTTKIMTCWKVLQLVQADAKVLDEELTVSAVAARTAGSSAQIREGDRYRIRDLLYGLMLPSGNDAAVSLAEHFGPRMGMGNGPADRFVAAMNRQAEDWKLAHTRYFDPHGLGKNHTSAGDLGTIVWHAMQSERFRSIVTTRRHRCEVMDAAKEKRTVTWTNTNRLLDIEGYDGVKTGTTTAAGFCLASSGRRAEDHLIVVVLGATSNDSRYIDTRNLYRWAWRERGHKM